MYRTGRPGTFIVKAALTVAGQNCDKILPLDGNHLRLGGIDLRQQTALFLLQFQQTGFCCVSDDAHFDGFQEVGSCRLLAFS